MTPKDPFSETVVDAIEERTTLSLRPQQDSKGFALFLMHYAENRDDTGASFPLTEEQNAIVRQFWEWVRVRRG